ncbi:anhydro-N-acetylmuramic acid kinase [Streptomyces alkaliterrae]|uniref:Anhydro-N-acetylmuramic acid kinase n=1 Tax=Streptomyces alkaliterrae TaxID=2213162 RepID=A0A5P0YPQ9_9ACTN|nr:anhydro-N-acetylmuramic acid kinase [Streptomyces alkaliterrae]MBB1258360.1 anhydro-N-acetylmuramic acid kinase [Streptomyces alkaliterrae]MQS02343.1 anhydro-N-acetylmuramic acid kinase [Streptomyces alkaliterrae]
MRMIGLLSGTSHDAADAAVTDLEFSAPGEITMRSRGLVSTPFPPDLRAELLAALPPGTVSAGHLCRLDTRLGRFFGTVAARALAGPADGRADWIVSHGQTVHHWVDGARAHGTLQLGAAAWIAEATGLPVVSDLRSRDVAAGGQGAPLVAALDALLLPGPGHGALNLGGIANLTVRLPTGDDGTAASHAAPAVLAYDVGPAGALLDEAVAWATNGESRIDAGGARAARGTVDRTLLTRLLDDPYYRLPPPKSTGKEHFHPGYLRDRLPEPPPTWDDLLATLTELTASLVADACRAHRVSDLYVSGGGLRNHRLMARLRARAADVRIVDSTAVGVPPQEKEALLFALLGFLTVHGVPANPVAATGARRPVLLGSLTPGRTPLRLPEPVVEPPRRLVLLRA